MSQGRSRNLGKYAARLLVAAIWLALLGLCGLVGLEWWLRSMEPERGRGPVNSGRPRFDRLENAYLPFRVQHLHPQYGFFFPLDPKDRVALSSDVVTLGAAGFRGPGPEVVNGRRLAFLLGGSTAFGHYASSDANTISGVLNSLQSDYFFVNAGVPSWNSTQEMFRLAYEVIGYRPQLVVTLDGANDAGLLVSYYQRGAPEYTFGSPESFLALRAMVGDIRAGPQASGRASLFATLFPAVTRRFDGEAKTEHAGNVDERLLDAGVDRYLTNLTRMRDLSRGSGTRFLAILQPISSLHRNVPSTFERSDQENDALRRFTAKAIERRNPEIEFYDFSVIFDPMFTEVPVLAADRDMTDDTIFLDRVHLTDRGNRLVAEQIVRLLKR